MPILGSLSIRSRIVRSGRAYGGGWDSTGYPMVHKSGPRVREVGFPVWGPQNTLEGETMKIAYHFTNSRTRWGDKSPWRSTGFVDNIVTNGARRFLNVGAGNPTVIRHEFQHHGTRCNKPRVHGNRSIPAVILFDITGLSCQQGYDSPYHVQVNELIPPNRVLGWFEFDPGIGDDEFSSLVQECS